MTTDKHPKNVVTKTTAPILAKDQANAQLVALMRAQQAAINASQASVAGSTQQNQSKASNQPTGIESRTPVPSQTPSKTRG